MKGHREDVRQRRLAADNRCVGCSEKLAYHDIGRVIRCESCRDDKKEENATIHRRYAAGERVKDLAAEYGRTIPSVRGVIARLREAVSFALTAGGEPGGGPRCRCGLLLPCHSCLPSIDAYAGMRRAPDVL